MSNEEKGQWVDLGVVVVTYIAYIAIILGKAGQTALTDIDYIPTLLAAIVIGIVLEVVGRMAVEIAGGKHREEADVRDRDIGRFGEYLGGTVLAMGMVVPFILTLTESDYFWIGNAMYLAFVVSAVAGAVAKLMAYRRGI